MFIILTPWLYNLLRLRRLVFLILRTTNYTSHTPNFDTILYTIMVIWLLVSLFGGYELFSIYENMLRTNKKLITKFFSSSFLMSDHFSESSLLHTNAKCPRLDQSHHIWELTPFHLYINVWGRQIHFGNNGYMPKWFIVYVLDYSTLLL